MELRHLRYFVMAAEMENFHRAAEKLHVAQPALSRRIKDLEMEIGVQLFERKLKRVRLSPAGHCYYNDISAVLKGLATASSSIKRLEKGEVGALTIGIHESLLHRRLLVTILQRFRAENPDVHLKLVPVTAMGVNELLAGDIEGLFTYEHPGESQNTANLAIGSEQWVLALPRTHRLARAKVLVLRDFEAEAFIWGGREAAPTLYDTLIAACSQGGLTPVIAQQAASEATRVQLVALGMGISFISSHLEGIDKSVVTRAVSDLKEGPQMRLVWRADLNKGVLDRFVANVAKSASQHKQRH